MEMKTLEHKSEIENVIVVKDIEMYRKLVLPQEDRPYDVVVLFNLDVEDQKARCEHCITMEVQYNQLVYSFIQDRKKKHEDKERNVFFLLYHLDSQDKIEVFRDYHHFSTIPILAVSPEGMFHGVPEARRGPFFPAGNFWDVSPGDVVTGLK